MEDRPSTVLDPSGDLRLSTSTQDFVVSSRVMCLVSPVWRAMFDPHGPWAKQSSGVFDLPEDDPDALLILLQIAHLQFSRLPERLAGYGHLLQLAVLCDKYDAVELVRPWILKWQAPLHAQAKKSGQKGEEPYEGYESWLFIAWVFGDEDVFRQISRSLVLRSTVTIMNGETRLENAQAVIVRDTPPGSVDAIIEARSERISALLRMCYKLVDQYESAEDHPICTGSRSSVECDTLVYGCLIRGLRSLNLLPLCAKASDVESSVMALADELRSLKCFIYPDIRSRHYSLTSDLHSSCDFTIALKDHVGDIISQEEPSGLLEAHLTHIAEQKKK